MTAPAVPAGLVAVIWVFELAVKVDSGRCPRR